MEQITPFAFLMMAFIWQKWIICLNRKKNLLPLIQAIHALKTLQGRILEVNNRLWKYFGFFNHGMNFHEDRCLTRDEIYFMRAVKNTLGRYFVSLTQKSLN